MVRAISSSEMPFSAAFSLSTSRRYFGWSSSTYQSTSTTPSVRFHRSRMRRAMPMRSLMIGPVDFGHQGFEHRRAGRHFRHFDARAVARGDRQQALAHLLGDLVALQFAVAFAAAGSPGYRPRSNRWRR